MPDAAAEGFGLSRLVRKMSAVLYALMLLIGGWTYVAWLLEQDHNRALETSQRRLGQFARGLGLQVEAMASDGLGAASVAAALRSTGAARPGGTASPGSTFNGGEYVRALFVVDESVLVVSQRTADDFESATARIQPALDVLETTEWAGPMVDTSSGRVFPVARRAVVDGRKVWVGAWLGSRDFEEVYADFNQPHSYVALTTLDGAMLGRFPPADSNPARLAHIDPEVHARALALPVHSTALMDGPDATSGQPFQYGVYRVAGLPLLAIAGRARDDALSSWRARRNKTLLFTVLTTVVVFGFAVGLQRTFNRSLESVQALARARRAELEAKESLTSQLMLAQDAERRRLAGELHDGIGQKLSLLRNQVLLLRRSELPSRALDDTRSLLTLASEAIDDLRNVARALRPIHLEEQGLTGALRALLNQVRSSSDLDLTYRLENVDDVVTGGDATHLYRIAQEAISNVIRHANATRLWIELIRDIAVVELHVRDDGRGMPADAGPSKGFGLLSIGERCRMLAATVTFASNSPTGTSLLVRVPIRNPPETPG